MSDSDRHRDEAQEAPNDAAASNHASRGNEELADAVVAGDQTSPSTGTAAETVPAESGDVATDSGEVAEVAGDAHQQAGSAVAPTATLAPAPEEPPDEPQMPRNARCLWCGSERPVDVAMCPTCQHSWVDATIDEARHGRLDTVAPTPAPIAPLRPWWRRPWIPIALAAAAVAVYGVVFWVLWDNTGGEGQVAATSRAPVATTQATSAPVETTEAPPAITAPTTSPPSTSSTTTTTTTTLPPIAVVEPPYDPASLTLGAFALGPIRFGSTDPDVVGRLAATFGQPQAQFEAGENWGLCPTESGRVLQFGSLSLILRTGPEADEVAGYRLQPPTDPADPTAALRSISGLGLGDLLSRAVALYSIVETAEQADGTPIFLVLRSSDRRTLLWGTLSADGEPVVTSINSPRPCDGGPFGS